MTDNVTVSRELLRQVLKAFEVATTPIAADRQEVLAAIAALRAALEQPGVEPHQVRWCDGCTPENCAGCVRV